jgi:hypothetical protein
VCAHTGKREHCTNIVLPEVVKDGGSAVGIVLRHPAKDEDGVRHFIVNARMPGMFQRAAGQQLQTTDLTTVCGVLRAHLNRFGGGALSSLGPTSVQLELAVTVPL